MNKRLIASLGGVSAALALAGCTSMIPRYERPAAPVPAATAKLVDDLGRLGPIVAQHEPQEQRSRRRRCCSASRPSVRTRRCSR